MDALRPWGSLDWVLSHIDVSDWAVLGTVSVEDRSIATVSAMGAALTSARLFAIHDPDPLDPQEVLKKLTERKREFAQLGIKDDNSYVDTALMATLDDINTEVDALLKTGAANIVLDISAMPKRWFFAILKILSGDDRVKNLLVTYASPQSYGTVLAENPGPMVMLPGFAGDGAQDYHSIIIGIGFEPLGIANLLKELRLKRIRLLFPFPPGPPGYNRNWMFVKSIEDMTRTQSIEPPDRQSIHMFDCPHIFDALCEMTNSGKLGSVLAPYGPKSMSLAMCLFSLAIAQARRPLVPIYYSQPTRYSIDYSTGIRRDTAERPDIKAYIIKLFGNGLYQLPKSN